MPERPPDPIWDALDLHFGPVRTKAERGRRNLAVSQLREAGAIPEEIAVAYAWCAKNFTVFTEMALVSHFGRAQHESFKPVASPLAVIRRMADDG
jgi:hypothetical protein